MSYKIKFVNLILNLIAILKMYINLTINVQKKKLINSS